MVGITVGMKHLRNKLHLRWAEGVVSGENELSHKHTTFER